MFTLGSLLGDHGVPPPGSCGELTHAEHCAQLSYAEAHNLEVVRLRSPIVEKERMRNLRIQNLGEKYLSWVCEHPDMLKHGDTIMQCSGRFLHKLGANFYTPFWEEYLPRHLLAFCQNLQDRSMEVAAKTKAARQILMSEIRKAKQSARIAKRKEKSLKKFRLGRLKAKQAAAAAKAASVVVERLARLAAGERYLNSPLCQRLAEQAKENSRLMGERVQFWRARRNNVKASRLAMEDTLLRDFLAGNLIPVADTTSANVALPSRPRQKRVVFNPATVQVTVFPEQERKVGGKATPFKKQVCAPDTDMSGFDLATSTEEEYPLVEAYATTLDIAGVGPYTDILWEVAPMSVEAPTLAASIISVLMGRCRFLLPADRMLQMVRSMRRLSCFYPEAAFAEQLNNLHTSADCIEADRAIAQARLEFEANIASTTNAKSILGSLFAWTKRAASSVAEKFYSGCEMAGERATMGIFKVMMSHFSRALAAIEHELGVTKQLLDALVVRVKQWYSNLITKCHVALEMLGKYTLWGLGLLFGCGLCTLTEKVLSAMNVNCNGMLLTGFCTATFAWMAIQMKGGCSEILSKMQVQLSALARGMFADACVPPSDPRRAFKRTEVRPEDCRSKCSFSTNTESYNAKSIPLVSSIVNALSTFGAGLISFKCEGLIEIGKLAAAMHSIRMGKEAMKEFISTVLEYLGKLSDKITGRETVFFDELSVLVKIDVKGWIRRAQGILLESNYIPLTNAAFADTILRVVHEGRQIQATVAGVPRKLSCDFGALIGGIMKDLTELQKKLVRCGQDGGKREEPAWIYLYGESHCGKSNLMSKLAGDLCREFDVPYTVCARNAKDEFYSGYARQSVMVIDDISAVETRPPLESELINLVSTAPYALNMADLADKPCMFQSPFIITSSNFIDAPAGCGVRDADAYRNRRAVLLQLRRKPNSSFNPSDPYAATECRFLDPSTHVCLTLDDNNQATWVSVVEATAQIMDIVAAHRDSQAKQMDFFLKNNAMLDPVCLAAENCLKKEPSKHFLHMCAEECRLFGIPFSDEGIQYVCVDDVLYKFEKDFEVQPVEHIITPNYKLWESRSLNTFLNGVREEQLLNSNSVIVSAFLRGLVRGDSSVVSVESLSAKSSDIQKRFFHKLSLSERIYLRLLQKKIDSINLEDPDNLYSDSIWQRVLCTIGQGKCFIEQHGGNILLLAAAFLCLILLCYAFFSVFVGFVTGSLTFAGALAGTKEVEAKSVQSSGSTEQRYRSRNIPVRHKYTFARSAGAQEMLEASDLCVAIQTAAGDFVSGIQYKNKSILLTRHQAGRFYNDENLLVTYSYGNMRSITIPWNKSHVLEIPNSELVLWIHPRMDQLPHRYVDLFMVDAERELPSCANFMAYVLRKDDDGAAYHYEATSGCSNVVNQSFTLTSVVDNIPYMNTLPRCLRLNYQARNHDCGMMILLMIAGKMKIAGVLVAGENNIAESQADILPFIELGTAKSTLEYIPEYGDVTMAMEKIGYLTRDIAPVVPKKTNLVKVESRLQVPCDVPIKEPAILHREDPRCPAGVDPLRQAFKRKYTDTMEELDAEILEVVAAEIVEQWFDCPDHECSDVDLDTAINGIDASESDEGCENFVLSTSPGFPFYIENRKNGWKGKDAYFEENTDGKKQLKEGSLAAKLYTDLDTFSLREVPELVVVECPKDEPLKAEKIANGDVRLFDIMPLVYNLLLRRKTMSFVNFLKKNRNSLSCQVGINPYSIEWTRLAQDLQSKNNVMINCDYSAFDGLLNFQMLTTIANMINEVFRKSGDTDSSLKQRFNLLMAIHGRLALLDNQVYKVYTGIPSGFALTVVVNSIFNEILIRYCYRVSVPKIQRDYFTQNVCLFVYGDDNLISVVPEVADYFNGHVIQSVLKEKRVKITDGSDKSAKTIEWKSLQHLDFLKRKFRKEKTGVFSAPLDRTAIFTSLYWLTPAKEKLAKHVKGCDSKYPVDLCDELKLNVNVALMELYLHGDEIEFNRVRSFYIEKLGNADFFRTWRQMEAFHSAQKTHMAKYEPVAISDIMVGPNFKRFYAQSAIGHEAHFYSEQLAVCGPFYKENDGDFLVSTTPLRSGENGVYVPKIVARGVGSLPTRAWVWAFGYKGKSVCDAKGYKCYNLIHENYLNGKKIIFRDEAPYVAGTAAMISFASTIDCKWLQEFLQVYKNVVAESLQGLDQYFEIIAPAAVIGPMYTNSTAVKTWFEGKDRKAIIQECGIQEKGATAALVHKDIERVREMNCFPFLGHNTMQNGKTRAFLLCDALCPSHIHRSDDLEDSIALLWKTKCAGMSSGYKQVYRMGPGKQRITEFY
nr:MAG: hypothetical protein [Secoviridae sp.]